MSRHFSIRILLIASCIFLGIALLAQPQRAAAGFSNGVQLCLHSILPALFPFFVLCELLATLSLNGRFSHSLARILGLQSGEAAAALMLSWVGGYAVCARMTGQLRRSGRIGARDASLLLLLGCCSSPGFVIGCVGGLLLGNLRLGILLYTLQLASNFLCAAFCLPLLPRQRDIHPATATEDSRHPGFPIALSNAVTNSLHVGGCVVFFRIIALLPAPLLEKFPQCQPILSAFCEISAGCADFAACGGRTALYGCCLCLSLLGISVWAQISLLLQNTVPLTFLIISRLLHVPVFAILVHICARYLPGSTTVYRSLAQRVVTTGRLPADAAWIVFLFLCAALYKLRQNFYNE